MRAVDTATATATTAARSDKVGLCIWLSDIYALGRPVKANRADQRVWTVNGETRIVDALSRAWIACCALRAEFAIAHVDNTFTIGWIANARAAVDPVAEVGHAHTRFADFSVGACGVTGDVHAVASITELTFLAFGEEARIRDALANTRGVADQTVLILGTLEAEVKAVVALTKQAGLAHNAARRVTRIEAGAAHLGA